MEVAEIFIIALALSMDAFAVTVSNSCTIKTSSESFLLALRDNPRYLALPIVFGIFQGVMPVIGYFLGSTIADIIRSYSGIISFLILGVIGAKMIFDGVKSVRNPTNEKNAAPILITIPLLLIQGIATSIDALIVGVDFLAKGFSIALAAPIVAITTLICCTIALWVGGRFSTILGNKAQIAGGIVLVLIGLKALLF